MHKLLLVITVFVLFAVTASGQERTIYGLLQDSITHFAIPEGRITNSRTSENVVSDKEGRFRIKAAPNDWISAVAPSYHFDSLTYSILFSDTITIFLAPSGNLLPGVTVTSQYTKYQLDSMRRREEFQKNLGTRLPAVSRANNSGFGVGINLDRVFKQKDQQKRSYEKGFPEREKSAYVGYRFSPYIVAHFTGLKGEPLRKFLSRYTPSYEWLRRHPTNEDVMYYINEKLKESRLDGTRG
ncbi:hypothetical protein EXU57_15505 [Segetibacter sp. 3557_3]|uniref:hypothetical protein n=1 Tax=Segetibacter sp. 3557_3 TaxID=2547429 RepID=UPI001058BEA2|nr:hypothetical protein [Segetibacter sp. 3557_3]TDH24218.1 hypothetical protein EXU57_15505 [Segetibacter sp. 3557_3]